MADTLVNDYAFSVGQSCSAAGLSRTAWYRRPSSAIRDAEVTTVLNKITDRWPRWGFWKCFNWIRT